MKLIHQRLISVCLTGVAFCTTAPSEGKAPDKKKPDERKPNVIYILADDMGYGDISALNPQSKIKTPTLDSLVRNGVSFTNAHSNSAVSTPTRYGILTGRYCFRSRLKAGVLVGYDQPLIEEDRPTVANLFKSRGYHTACIGKWHLGLNYEKVNSNRPLTEGDPWGVLNTSNVDYSKPITGGPKACGFDYSYIIPSSLDIAPYLFIRDEKITGEKVSAQPSWSDKSSRGRWYRGGDVASDFKHSEVLENLVNDAKSFINNKAKSDSAFFLYLALTSPHTPWLPSEKFLGKSGAGTYGDFVMMTDAMVKEIAEACKKQGIDDNTIIIFASDNGSHWLPSDIQQYQHESNHGTSGMKGDVWDGGHRIPLIVYWPNGTKKGASVDKIVCTTDLFATCAQLLGSKLSDNEAEDSFSMLTLISSKFQRKEPHRISIIHHGVNGDFGIREGRWKYIDCKGSGGWSSKGADNAPEAQLYNIEADPLEKNNLILQHPKIAKRLKALLEKQKTDNKSR